jgi:hypothetical protein
VLGRIAAALDLAKRLEREFAGAVQAARRAGLSASTLWSEAGKEHVARWLEKDGLWPAPPVPVP